jgi:hypothetical protein
MPEVTRRQIDSANLYGLLAEYHRPEDLVAAATKVRAAGFSRFDAYSPLPVEDLADAIGVRPTRLPLVTLAGGVAGGVSGYGMQYWMMVIDYPLNIGGRPLHSWPAFIPVTFELTILGASLAAVLGMLALNKLPEPYHPLFAISEFSLASQNRFFLCVEASDVLFDAARTKELLEQTGATAISVVEA